MPIKPETGKGIEADMLEALRFARFRETEADKSVATAWARFEAAMRRAGGL